MPEQIIWSLGPTSNGEILNEQSYHRLMERQRAEFEGSFEEVRAAVVSAAVTISQVTEGISNALTGVQRAMLQGPLLREPIVMLDPPSTPMLENQFLNEDVVELSDGRSPFPNSSIDPYTYLIPEGRRLAMEYSVREIAKLIPEGTLGFRKGKDWRDDCLVFRSDPNEPDLEYLYESGWFKVRGDEGVLWAPATLEAYTILEESEISFEESIKVSRWRAEVTRKPGRMQEWPEDCPLFPYQKEGTEFLAARRRAILSLSPGLGKTLVSAYAAALDPRKRRILLVCPASLLHYWQEELEKWSPYLPQKPVSEIWHRGTGTVPSEVAEGTQFWCITNPETLTRRTKEFFYKDKRSRETWDLMIADESIMFKHRGSLRSKKLGEVSTLVDSTWLLTGAPATRYIDDMWHQFHILNNRGYPSYWRFAERYCVVVENPWSKTVKANRKGAEAEIKKNFADVYFARNQSQVLNIPDWLMEDIDIEMKPKQEAVYTKLQKELLIKLASMPMTQEIHIDNRLSLVLRSLQVASNPVLVGSENSSGKWSALPELMELYPGPFIIWVNFIRTGEIIQGMLQEMLEATEEKVVLVNGATSSQERNEEVNRFQKGAYRAIILNNQVGKFGFTLTRARTAIFLERSFDDSYFQCLYRNRRIGTKESPVVLNLRSVTQDGKRTIDHVVHSALDYRNRMIKKLTVGDLYRNILGDSPNPEGV